MAQIKITSQNCASKQPKWKSRVNEIARVLLKHDADVIAFQELYAGQRKDLERLIGHAYGIAAIRSGRVIAYRLDRVRPVGSSKWANMRAGKSKPAVGRKFEFIKTGERFNVINVHLSYEVTASGSKNRRSETRNILKWAHKQFPADRRLYAGDWNSPAGATNRSDDSGPIMAAHSYKDLGIDSGARLGRGHYHIDRVFGSRSACEGIKTTVSKHSGSDHPATSVLLKFRVK